MTTITLKTSSMEGKIHVGREVIENRLPALTQGQKNFVVTDRNVYFLYRDWFEKYFPDTETFILPAGEENKNFQSLFAILKKMTGAGMHRSSRLFAVGGGVIGDIGGLAAALYMRGVSCVQIPTTLLAQVDSSVGGKTAVDLGNVKNIVGAFYQPCEVLVDPAFLQTLPEREIKCGLGEIIKYCALNEEILHAVEENLDRMGELDFLETLILPCIMHKARVVELDEKETGERRCLNVGHTTGHAIELSCALSHGESVLYGMLAETRMAIEKEVCDPIYGEGLLAIIKSALAVSPQNEMDFSDIESYAEKAKTDKKNGDDGLIVMSVAKEKGEWTVLSLPFMEYQKALKKALE